MTSLTHQSRRALRFARRLSKKVARRANRTAQQVSHEAAFRTPPGAGPKQVQSFVTETRMQTAADVAQSDPRAALELYRPMMRDDAPPEVWLAVSGLYERLRKGRRANEAAAKATRAPGATLETLRERRLVATRTGFLDEERKAYEEFASIVPGDPKEMSAVVGQVRRAPREVIEQFLATMQAAPDDAPMKAVGIEHARAMLAEDDLVTAHAEGPEVFEPLKLQVLQERRNPLLIVLRALTRRRAWREAADFACVTPGSQLLGPNATVHISHQAATDAARQALKAGHATPAAMLAGRALGAKPKSRSAREVFTAAHDQIRILRSGWEYPDFAETPAYDVDPRSALAVLSQSMPHTGGGYATRTHGILTGLAARDRRIEAITRMGFPYDRWPSDAPRVRKVDDVDGILYHRILDRRRVYPQHPLHDYIEGTAAGVERQARAQRAGIIHASSFYVAGMAGLTAARRLGVPFIYEMRGLEELMKISRDEDFAGSEREAFLQLVENGVAREADHVLPLTKALRDEMVDRGVAPDKITVIPNGVHTDQFAPMVRDSELEAKFEFEGKTVIGYVGGLVDYEGVDLLLEAVTKLRTMRDKDDFRVLIVGDGHYERVVRQVAVDNNLLDIVTFTGRVPHKEVGRHLSLVDIAPFPRLPLPVCEMISPIKPFESMAMGKAVISSDVAALAEIVTDHKTGRLFRKGDRDSLATVLNELIDDPNQRRTLGTAAREWVVAERDWKAITGIVDGVYDEVLARRGML